MGGLSALGLLSGFGQQAHEDNLLKLQQAAQQKEAMMGFYKSIMADPNLEHMAPEAAQAFLHISSTPIDQKWDKSAQKFIKQYDPSALNQQAIERHASQHPGVQQAQQLQLPPGLTPPPRPGVPGQQVGAADGAAHQTAMNSPGVGAVPGDAQQQPQQQQTSELPVARMLLPPIEMTGLQPTQMSEPPQQNPQAVGMLSQTTQMQQGALPSPGPVPQITPSPAQASASAGTADPLGQAPVMPDSMVHPHWGRTPAERAEQAAYGTAMEQRAKLTGTLQETKALRRDAEQVKKDWLADPATQKALAEHDYMTLGMTAPPSVTLPNMAGMMTPKLLSNSASGSEAAPGTLDSNGHPVDPQKHYTTRLLNGQKTWEPTDVKQQLQWMADPKNPQQMVLAQIDPYSGQQTVVQDASRINPAMIPQVSTNNTVRIVPQADGTLAAIPVTSTTTRQRGMAGAGAHAEVPGTLQPGGTLTQPPSSTRPATTAQPKGSAGPRIVGQSPGVTKAQMENPLTAEGQKVMADIDPRLHMIQDLKAKIKEKGWDKTDMPGTTLLDRLAYEFGHAGDVGGFLSQLELGSITQAAGVMKGSSKAIQALNKAMVHTPNGWKDSGKLMYDKLGVVEKNLKDVEDSAQKYFKRYPGLTNPPAAGTGGAGQGAGHDPLGIL